MKYIIVGALLLIAGCSTRESTPETLMRPDIGDLGPLRQERIAQAETALQAALNSGNNEAMANAYGELAMHYHAYRAEEAAVFYYQKAFHLQPGNFIWPYCQGKALKTLTRIEEGHQYIEIASQLNPNYPPALVELGEYHRKRNGMEKARTCFQQALEQDGNCVAAMVGLAQLALSQENYSQAAALMKKALNIQPQSSIVNYIAGMAARGLGQLDEARALLENQEGKAELFLKDPAMEKIYALSSDGKAHFKEGQKAMTEGRYEQARDLFKAAVSSQPNIPEYWTKLGFASIKAGDLEGALKAYQRVLQDRPAHPDIHYNIAGLLMEMGKGQEAAPYFDKAFELDPENKRARLFAVDLHRISGNFQNALSYYEAMVQDEATSAEGRLGRALMLIRLHQYKQARKVLEEDVKVIPKQPAFRQALARILAASPEKTVRDGPRAVKLAEGLLKNGEDSAVSETLAMAYAETGQFEKALKWQRKAIVLAGDNEKAPQDPALRGPLESFAQKKPLRLPWPDSAPLFLVQSYGRR